MTQPVDLSAKLHLIIEVDRLGPETAQFIKQLQEIGVATDKLTISQGSLQTSTASTTGSVRMLLLNLRMFSFGIRTLRREFGSTNPLIENFSRGLIVIAAVGTSAIAGVDLIRKSMARLGPILAGINMSTIIGSTKILIGLLGGPVSVAAALLAITSIPFLLWAQDSVTGVHALRQEAKSLQLELQQLETHMKTLRAEQNAFNLTTSATSLLLQELQRALDLAGGENAALEARIASANAELVNQQIEAGYASLAIESLSVRTAKAADVAEDAEIRAMARKYAQTAWGAHPGAYGIGEDIYYETMKSLGTTDRPSVQALREQNAGAFGGGGESTNVTINFPGAVFNTEGDIEGALQAGAEKAGRILYNQYGMPGRQR